MAAKPKARPATATPKASNRMRLNSRPPVADWPGWMVWFTKIARTKFHRQSCLVRDPCPTPGWHGHSLLYFAGHFHLPDAVGGGAEGGGGVSAGEDFAGTIRNDVAGAGSGRATEGICALGASAGFATGETCD